MPADDSQHQSRRKVALIVFLWFGIGGTLGFALISSISGKLSWLTPFLGLGLGLTFLFVYLFGSSGDKTLESGTEPELEELIALGHRRGQITISASDYPRPVTMGSSLIIPRQVLDTWSPRAIRWWVAVEHQLFERNKQLLGLFCILSLMGLVGVGFGMRQNSIFLVAGSGLVCLFLIILLAIQDRPKVLSIDREVTKTEEDRLAAKEALSNAYFVQVDRPLSKRFMLSASFLKRRADALGITLERGFHVPRGD